MNFRNIRFNNPHDIIFIVTPVKTFIRYIDNIKKINKIFKTSFLTVLDMNSGI